MVHMLVLFTVFQQAVFTNAKDKPQPSEVPVNPLQDVLDSLNNYKGTVGEESEMEILLREIKVKQRHENFKVEYY